MDHSTVVQKLANNKNKPGTGGPSVRGRQLAIRERLNVKKAYYHWEGTFFEKVREFPAALFDRFGYVVFDSEQKYLNDPKVFVGKKTNIPSRINTFTEYVKMSRPAF
ncbi:MAG: hypothetical protein O3B95_04000 [Chloroflexi bacterium]|nr:hypothetical protein [Chloroflexota bacterium]